MEKESVCRLLSFSNFMVFLTVICLWPMKVTERTLGMLSTGSNVCVLQLLTMRKEDGLPTSPFLQGIHSFPLCS